MSNGPLELGSKGSNGTKKRLVSTAVLEVSSLTKDPEIRRTSWWFWTAESLTGQSDQKVPNNPNPQLPDYTEPNGHPNEPQQHQTSFIIQPSPKLPLEDPEGLWQTTFRRMSLVFHRDDLETPQGGNGIDDEQVAPYRDVVSPEGGGGGPIPRSVEIPVDTEDLSSLNESDSIAAPGWFDWLWTSSTAQDSINNSSLSVDLLKQARQAIESHKQTIFYAFHSNSEDPYGELAVSNTKTAQTPVSFKPKKLPRLVNQAQEHSLDVAALQNQLIPAAKSPQSSSAVLSIASISANISLTSSILVASISTIIPQPHIIPSIDANFREITLKTKTRLVGEHLLRDDTSERHIYRVKNPLQRQKKTQKVVIIGVHGFLPFKMVKTLIDQPTGNAQMMIKTAEKTLNGWLDPTRPHKIDTISLEGKGTIKSSLKQHYLLLQNWIHLIEQCDFLLFTGNYQGSVIAIQLLAKLIRDNHLKHSPKLGLLSLLGLHFGPTAGADTKIVIRAFTPQENAVMNEIFELAKPNSATSDSIVESWKFLLDQNVKITLCGLFGDQFIPLYLLLNLRILHPNIYRIISISGDTPRFLGCLLNICLMLLNLGLSDHGVIAELLRFCQLGGRGFGGMKTYTNLEIYLTSIRLTLETTSLKRRRPAKVVIPIVEDLYHLPWKIRELMETLIHTKHIHNLSLIQELLLEYNSWEPTNKNWKDLKYALEGLLHFLIQDFL